MQKHTLTEFGYLTPKDLIEIARILNSGSSIEPKSGIHKAIKAEVREMKRKQKEDIDFLIKSRA